MLEITRIRFAHRVMTKKQNVIVPFYTGNLLFKNSFHISNLHDRSLFSGFIFFIKFSFHARGYFLSLFSRCIASSIEPKNSKYII